MTGTRYLGLDVGSRRVGVAVSDDLGIVATPVGFVQPGPKDREEFRVLVDRYGIAELVAGIPRNMSGKEGPQAAEVRKYANALARDLGLPVTYWDERLTSVIAERSLISGGRTRNQRKQEIDAAAAAVMLQGFLDSRSRINRGR
ncbi:MAG: Holliday junction resolvase RuvX [Chloroflexota bacterium]|nr:Holliday junction resolvase RuvX [Chloroflexota bacterium]